MTIEIRELVIKAELTNENITSQRIRSSQLDKEEEARLITLISKHVLEQLREDRGREI
ncbi:DUF5908 family protein [Aeromonas jandaei]|uniref:DUF5908 family protein n=1 Tax=Aeromonas jandaei TaxID=650 RepID=UPI003BA13674